MKFKPVSLIVLAVLIVSLSCMSTTQVSNNSGQTQVPQLSSPFAAEATSPMSVQLAWQPVAGVQKYLLAVRLGDSEFIPIAELPADQTSFEDFPVPDSSELTYRLQAVTSSATSDVGTATVTTSEIIPNPLTVQANGVSTRYELSLTELDRRSESLLPVVVEKQVVVRHRP